MRRPRLLVAVLAVGALSGAACGSDPQDQAADPTPAIVTPSPEPTPEPAIVTPSPEPTPEPEPEYGSPVYESSVREIDDATRAAMEPTSWRPGCPVGLEELRVVAVSHWDYEGRPATGELIVHRDHADGIAQVFGRLFAARFPIERIDLVDRYGGDDQASMRANNTSAFNCREVAYSPGVWSNHAFGAAIDVNPLVNPYVDGGFVDPPEGVPYLDRTLDVPGLIRDGDVVVEAFAEIGWQWGGHWTGAADYQHFSADGR